MGETHSSPGIARLVANPEAFRYYVRLARLEAWLSEHYADEVSLAVAARVVGLNAKYFSRFFRDKTGVRFSTWVHAVRIEKATEKMRSSNLPVTTVAFDVGFNDLRTFERVFKKQMGMTPRDYRDTVRPDAKLQRRGTVAALHAAVRSPQ